MSYSWFQSQIPCNKYLSPVRNTEEIVDMMPISRKTWNLIWEYGGQRAYLMSWLLVRLSLGSNTRCEDTMPTGRLCCKASSLGSLFQRPSLAQCWFRSSGDEYPPMALISDHLLLLFIIWYTVRFSSQVNWIQVAILQTKPPVLVAWSENIPFSIVPNPAPEHQLQGLGDRGCREGKCRFH